MTEADRPAKTIVLEAALGTRDAGGATDDCCECCGDPFTTISPASASSVDPSICEWCYVNGYDGDCDQQA